MALRPQSPQTAMSEINVTPLVDVMLVLLIIFMVTTPLLESGIDVNLPEATTGPIHAKGEKQIILAITKDQKLYIDKTPAKFSGLRKKLSSIYKNIPHKQIYVRADKSVPYGFVAKVMAEIRMSGIESIGLVTEPLKGI